MTFEPLTQERRRAMTRRHLLDAAAIVFAQKGFHGATLDEVAATAGFTKGAVYSNFKSKDDLFLAVLDDRVAQQMVAVQGELAVGPRNQDVELPRMRDVIRQVIFGEGNDDWNALYLEFVLYARRNPEAREKLAAQARRSRDAVTVMIEHEWARRGVTPEISPHAEAIISLALFNGLATERLVDPSEVDEETLDTALRFMYSALGVDDEEPAK